MSREYILVDEQNVDFVPQTCKEAILLFYRIRKSGMNDHSQVPEVLQQCAIGLDQTEHDLFYKWICNPMGLEERVPDLEIDEKSPN